MLIIGVCPEKDICKGDNHASLFEVCWYQWVLTSEQCHGDNLWALMSWNFMTSVPYVSHRSRFIVFLSLSNLDFVKPEGTLFEKSALGRISEIKIRRTPAS